MFEAAEAGARVALLVVDDHAIIREFIRLALAETHIDVTLAATGQDAIDLAKAQRFDVAIVDYRLPDMDGFAVARHVRSSPSSNVGVAKVVLSTASALDQMPPTLGVFDAHLLKPLTPRAVIETLSDGLSTRSVSH
jgi:CheY-like chemotaxis protein